MAWQVVSRLGIMHLLCDPDQQERERLGIYSLNDIVVYSRTLFLSSSLAFLFAFLTALATARQIFFLSDARVLFRCAHEFLNRNSL